MSASLNPLGEAGAIPTITQEDLQMTLINRVSILLERWERFRQMRVNQVLDYTH